MPRWSDARETYVEVGDRRLFARMLGAGDPCVVFEAGAGVSGNYWGAVQESVAEVTSAVVYDRAGLGLSDPDDRPRTLARAVSDLEAVLDTIAAPRFVLVGHSLGGPIVRMAAAAHRERIAALVLVDPSDEGCDLYYSPTVMRQQRIATAIQRWAARVGATRPVARRLVRTLPADAAAAVVRHDTTVEATRVATAETEIVDEFRWMQTHPPELGDLPVTIISGTAPSRFGAKTRAQLIESHRVRAESLPNGRHVEATRSGHMIPWTEPDVITAEVLRLVR